MSKRLDEIEARVEAATPGPWGSGNATPTFGKSMWDAVLHSVAWSDPIAYCNYSGSDARFIAAARTDVPYLLAIARAAERAVDGSCHGFTCELVRGGSCGCGLDALRAALEGK